MADNPHAMTGVSVLGLILVAVGAMSGMQAHFLSHPTEVAAILALAFGVNIGFHLVGALLFLRIGQRRAMTVGILCGNRNVTLAWAAAGSMLADHARLELYLAMSVLPIFLLPACWRLVLGLADRHMVRVLAQRSAREPKKSPSLATIALLASFPALSPLSIDLGQPAMPLLTAAFDAPPTHVGLTLSLFMAGFGLAQLIAGPISDSTGRKPPLVAGSILYALAGIGCALAPNIFVLIFMRLLQGLGAGTCTVIAFAVIRDRYEGAVARICLASINAVMWTAPIIAPAIGVGLLTIGGWRLLHVVLAGSGVLLIVLSSQGFTESLRRPDRTALVLRRIVGNYRTVLSQPSGAGHAVLVGVSFGGMFAYVAGASPTFQGYLAMSPAGFAATFATIASGLTTGSVACARLATRGFASRQVTSWGVAGLLVSSLALLAEALSETFTVPTAVPLLFLNAAATGLAMPGAVQGAMQPFPTMAGTASAVQGCLRMVGAAVSSALVAILNDGTPVAMALVMTIFAAAGGLVWWRTTAGFESGLPAALPGEPGAE